MPRADKQKDGYFQLILPSSPPPSHLITFWPPPPQTKSDSIYGQPLMPRADKQKYGSFQHIPPILSEMTSFMHDSPFSLILCWSLSFLLLLVTFWLTLPGGE